ncbi:hypothetical protein P154DRAFT_579486 [Amniculicola lignicola CBS 123094]|uniref:Uncharacterized protein n=1 Tax=Amniculicola lignicola CBS 123094 TaxID=1392246 RepID=A0A6A5W7L1_9PLEO|nr:hypothetical protein P154DRAFT_579486 [Amniculicola lignicola CBS 123094]
MQTMTKRARVVSRFVDKPTPQPASRIPPVLVTYPAITRQANSTYEEATFDDLMWRRKAGRDGHEAASPTSSPIITRRRVRPSKPVPRKPARACPKGPQGCTFLPQRPTNPMRGPTGRRNGQQDIIVNIPACNRASMLPCWAFTIIESAEQWWVGSKRRGAVCQQAHGIWRVLGGAPRLDGYLSIAGRVTVQQVEAVDLRMWSAWVLVTAGVHAVRIVRPRAITECTAPATPENTGTTQSVSLLQKRSTELCARL